MSPTPSAHWRPALRFPTGLRRCASGVVLLAVAAVVVLYLAGYFLLWSFHWDPRRATPLTVITYAHYYGHVPLVRRRVMLCVIAGVGLVSVAGVLVLIPKPRSLHGDARFATHSEIARAGLLSLEGIILGELGSRYLMLPGQQSVMLAAPPRSGKDVGIVVPNGLNWPDSLVVVDIKRESWTLTAGYRAARGQACYRFEPLNFTGDTARWNCLSYVSANPDQRINDLQQIADILYAEAPGTDPFWTASARSLFLGISLYLFETPSMPKTMGEVRRQGMATDDEGFGAHWKRVVQGRQSGRYPLSAECVRALYDVIDLAPVTASSVRKTFTSRLDLWANPLLDAATRTDDFDFCDLRRKKMSIYVCVNPDDLHRLRPLLSLFFQQCIAQQTKELPEHNPALIYQVLMVLNEFTALGSISVVSTALPYLGGYNLRVLMVIQANSQLRDVYGVYAAETMLKSVAARIVFSPKDYADAKEISDELGTTTVRARSHSRPSFLIFNRQAARGESVTLAQHSRALLLPQEVKELGNEVALIFYEGLRPIRCRKIRYYADARFRARLLPAPDWATPGRRAVAAPTGSATSVSPARTTTPQPGSRPLEAAPLMATLDEVATVEDIEHLDSLTLDDFDERLRNLTFEHADERPTDQELAVDVDRFLDALR